jgi:beta-glucanase (GH16 family)
LTTTGTLSSVIITLHSATIGVTVIHLNLSAHKPVLLLMVLAATVVTMLIGILPACAVTAPTVPTAPTGWTTVFRDDFAGPAGVAPSVTNWFYDIGSGGNWGMGEVDRATRSTQNVYLDGDGHLVLRAVRGGAGWTSGRIESTREDFAAPAGGELEMTASIELPAAANALGYWPAFWAVGSPKRAGGVWPLSGELDMMEDVNGLNAVSQTMHDGAGSTGTGLIACTASRCDTGFHTYSLIVNRANATAEYLQFLMDGKVRETVTEAKVGAMAWKKAVDHGFFIILDLAIGGTYPDVMCKCPTPTAATTSGASMKVAYVAVYEKGGNTTPTSRAIATGHATGYNGWCLDNSNSLNTTANVVDADGCGSGSGLRWSLYSDRTLRTEGGCLGFWGATANSGSWVDWYPCNGTAAQAWTRASNSEFVNPASGLCLSVPSDGKGVQLTLQTCTDSAPQRWTSL